MNLKQYSLTIDRERCKGCELCAGVCPRTVLALSPKLNSRGQHYAFVTTPANCIGCAQCSDMCPDAAIEIDEEVTSHA